MCFGLPNAAIEELNREAGASLGLPGLQSGHVQFALGSDNGLPCCPLLSALIKAKIQVLSSILSFAAHAQAVWFVGDNIVLFISHDQEDVAPLSQVRLIVKLAGVPYWSTESLQAGVLLREQLRLAIRDCDVCLFIATRRSIGSSWCRAELGAFWGAGKRVVSLLQDPELTDGDLPPQLHGDLWTRDAEVALKAIRDEIAAARMRDPIRDLDAKRAVCLVGGLKGSVQSTGYLVAPDLVVCTDYSAGNMGQGMLVSFFGGETVQGDVILDDETAGTAVLRLARSMDNLVPLTLTESVQTGTSCRGMGFPSVASGSAVPFQCEVIDGDHTDKRGSRWVVVHSPLFATTSLAGFGGSPVWISTGVVGHIYRTLREPGQNTAAFGVAYLSPSAVIMETLARAVDVRSLTRR
jgi:hypothetical protein